MFCLCYDLSMIAPILRLPSTQDSELARASLNMLHQYQENTESQEVEPINDLELQIQHQTMRLPSVAVGLLERILSELANGNAVAITPIQPEMSQALPWMERPAALDGTMAGDVGFDPLGFAKSKEDLMNYREAEVCSLMLFDIHVHMRHEY